TWPAAQVDLHPHPVADGGTLQHGLQQPGRPSVVVDAVALRPVALGAGEDHDLLSLRRGGGGGCQFGGAEASGGGQEEEGGGEGRLETGIRRGPDNVARPADSRLPVACPDTILPFTTRSEFP